MIEELRNYFLKTLTTRIAGNDIPIRRFHMERLRIPFQIDDNMSHFRHSPDIAAGGRIKTAPRGSARFVSSSGAQAGRITPLR
jgi:hypothetical protein